MDDNADDPIALRRERERLRAKRLRLVALAGVVGVVLVAGLIAYGVGGGTPAKPSGRPTPGREGVTWDHPELVDYLRSQGIKVELGAAPGPPGTAIYLAVGNEPAGVFVDRLETPQKAEDRVAASDELVFSWGRFFFRSRGQAGDRQLLVRISDVLQSR